MRSQSEKAKSFRALHERPGIFVIPNPWDAGSAKLLAALGFEALATTSLGYAASIGRNDGTLSREDVLANSRIIAEATDLPVSVDLENCYAHEPKAAAWRETSSGVRSVPTRPRIPETLIMRVSDIVSGLAQF